MKELRDGVYLYTQEEIISEQKSWGKTDESKNVDFTTHEFWISTGGEKIIGIDDYDDLKEAGLDDSEIEDWKKEELLS